MYIHIVRGTSYTNLELLRVNRELHGAKVFPAKDICVFILYSVDFFQLFYIVPFFSNPDDSTNIKVLVICLVVNFKIMGI